MSFRHQIICIFLGFGLLAGARFAWDLRAARQSVENSQTAGIITLRAGEFLGAAFALAAERGLTNALLANPAGAAASAWQAARGRRAEAEATLAAGLAGIQAMPGLASAQGVASALQAVAQARQAGQALRTRIDQQGAPPVPAAEWFAAVSAEIDAVTGLRRTIEGSQALGRNRAEDLTVLRDALAEAAEFAGRERGLVNGAIACGTPLTAAELRALGAHRGRIEGAWGRAETLLPRIGDAAVVAASQQAGRAYLRDFQATRAAALAASDGGAAWPLTPTQWFAAASTAIDAMNTAQRGVTEAILRDSAGQTETDEAREIVAMALLLAAFASVVLLIWHVQRALLRPLAGVIARVGAMQGGDLERPVGEQQRGHEIGALARAVEGFRLALLMGQTQRATHAQAAAAAAAAHDAALQVMATKVEQETRRGIAGMGEQMGSVLAGAAQVCAAAELAAKESNRASAAAGEAMENAQAVAAATEQLSASIGVITDRLGEASQSTRIACDLGANGREMIGALAEAVGRIGGVARLIGSIAGQTNLLALNATIEAARSGEAGKGFAVVAGEVKALAAQTARATGEISREIGEVMQSTQRAVAVVREMADAVAGVDQVTTAIASAMEEQTAATREIAGAVARAAAASGRVSEAMREVSEASAGSGREAEAMRGSSAAAQQSVERALQTIIGAVRESVATGKPAAMAG